MTLAEYLGSLSVPAATVHTFEAMIDAGYKSIQMIQTAHPNSLSNITTNGGTRIGERAHGISKWFNDPENKPLLDAASIWVAPDAPMASIIAGYRLSPGYSSIQGVQVCTTGAGPIGRADIAALIKAAGGRHVTSVGRTTDLLVTNDPKSTTGKMKDAAKHGTKVIGYDEFLIQAKG